MGHQFFGFTADSFEQFARAVALATLGPGVTVFGDGPDGGREAIFNGTVPYPHPPTDQWSGYGVIQAKCKAKTEGTEKDQKWALDLLKKELDLFVTAAKRTPKPEYYVYVTNVDLSAGGQGWDAADTLVKSYHGKLPLKGHAVWGASQLSGYVDQFEGIRRRFTAYLTPDDVLAALLNAIEGRRPNIEHILTTFLSQALLDDETSRLDQAGARTDEKLRIANLFVDLPATAEQSLDPSEEECDADGNLPTGVLADLLRDGSRRLDPEAVYEFETGKETEGKKVPTRYVLLGGFGSGKSTIGQLLAQIHRAALLERRPRHLLESAVRNAIYESRQACLRERLPWPKTPRFPFRVELSRFAKALTDGKVGTLADYLRNTLRGAADLEHDDFLNWLKLAPCLLILDGLDEVPPAGNRDAVVGAVNAFLIEGRHAGADLFVVATSRREGYGGEFTGGVVEYRSFRPLSQARALRYVQLYARSKFGATTQAGELVEKLRDAAANPLTASLMSSPLQVTFMATVVSARGDPGQDRWQLFSKYYETIYERELQKGLPRFQQVLAGHKDVIDRLHHEIGFWLQFQGEVAGTNSVSLQVDQLRQLAVEFLGPEAKGFKGRQLDDLADTITEAARRRLVFLTSRVEGELAFEVRGLQEYSAAECLMSGPPDRVLNRLKVIASSPYWRNVFLFVAGKCFFDVHSRHYQDPLRLLCEDLNASEDPILEVVHAGSELGLAVLESGAPANNPTYTRHLSRLALELLTQPDVLGGEEGGVRVAERLSAVYTESAHSSFRDALQTHVGQADPAHTLGAWPLLTRLSDRGLSWAQELADRYWPRHVQDQRRIVLADPDSAHSKWLSDRVYDLIPKLSPFASPGLSRKNTKGHSVRTNEANAISPCPVWYSAVATILEFHFPPRLVGFLPDLLEGVPFRASFTSLFGDEGHLHQALANLRWMPSGHPEWVPFREAHLLLEKPGAETLAAILRSCLARGYDPSSETARKLRFWRLPWPLGVCLAKTRSQIELADLVVRAERGQLGDTPEWQAAENRWAERGVSISDLTNLSAPGSPFDASIAATGFPIATIAKWSMEVRAYSLSEVRALLAVFETDALTLLRGKMLWVLWNVIIQCQDVEETDFNRLTSVMQGISGEDRVHLDFERFPARDLPAWWSEFYNAYGLAHIPVILSQNRDTVEAWKEYWEREYIREPRRLGLLRLLGRCVASGCAVNRVPPTLLSSGMYSDRRIDLAALLVRLSSVNLTSSEVQGLTGWATRLLDPLAEPDAADLIFSTVEMNLVRVPALETFLIALRERLPPSIEFGVARCEGLLRRVVQRRPSGLQLLGQLAGLELPNLATSSE
jgi:hypothetical protein